MTTIINVNLFDYNQQTQTLSAEASTLEGANVVWGYALTVKSYKTGNEINFRFDHAEYDASHEDVLAAVYVPSDSISPIKQVVIYND